MKNILTLAAFSLSLGLAGSALGGHTVSDQDRQFVEQAGLMGLAEVQIVQLGVERASDAGIKAFAEGMATDYTAAMQELTTLAQSHEITLPSEITEEQQALIDQFKTLEGTAFEKEFIAHSVTAHETAIELFTKEVNDGTEACVKAFASNLLTKLQAHLAEARTIAQAQQQQQQEQQEQQQQQQQEEQQQGQG